MSLFLASVRDAAEAGLAVESGADIVDLKDPAQGALGAVSDEAARAAIAAVGGRVPVSITLGDLPLRSALLEPVLRKASEAGPDFIKIGLFEGSLRDCGPVFRAHASHSRLIAVFFADRWAPGSDGLGAIKQACDFLAASGFKGVMADTADKANGGLINHWPPDFAGAYLEEARRSGLFAGLAGGLQCAEIPDLLPLAPDVLGFRGALCEGGRNGRLDPKRCAAVRGAIPRNGATPGRVPVTLAEPPSPLDRGRCPMIPQSKILAARFLSPRLRPAQPELDKVLVRDLVLPARIGVWSEEQGIAQRVRFSVELSVYPAPRCSDDFEFVISYDFILNGIKAIIAEGHVLLAETLAERIAQHCLSDRRAAQVRVLVEKLDRVPGASLGCEIIRRQKAAEEANVYLLMTKAARGMTE